MKINPSKGKAMPTTEEEYLQFWKDTLPKLSLAASLDPPQMNKLAGNNRPSRIIYGAEAHEYGINPVNEETIQEYERVVNINLPLNFRTYLKIFGCRSGGPGNGIDNIFDNIQYISKELHTPCPLEPREGMGHARESTDPEETFFNNEYEFIYGEPKKGTLDIGDAGNPTVFRLVVHGATRGDVFADSGDVLRYEGSFEQFYINNLNETISTLRSKRNV